MRENRMKRIPWTNIEFHAEGSHERTLEWQTADCSEKYVARSQKQFKESKNSKKDSTSEQKSSKQYGLKNRTTNSCMARKWNQEKICSKYVTCLAEWLTGACNGRLRGRTEVQQAAWTEQQNNKRLHDKEMKQSEMRNNPAMNSKSNGQNELRRIGQAKIESQQTSETEKNCHH